MTTYSLFLDDERDPSENSDLNWVICRNTDEAMEMIKSCMPDFISFDHDLGERSVGLLNKNGLSFAKDLVEYDLEHNVIGPSFDFTVHSMNPVGADNIEKYLRPYITQKFQKKE